MKNVWQYLLAIRTDATTVHVLGIDQNDWWWSTPVVELTTESARTRSGSRYQLGNRIDDISVVDAILIREILIRDGSFLIVPADVDIADLQAFIDVGRAHAIAADIMITKSWLEAADSNMKKRA